MKKIVIFGATGNIGMYLVDYLKDRLNCDYEIIAVGRQKKAFFEQNGIRFVNVDICCENDFDNLPTDDIYAVINLAGILPAYTKNFDVMQYAETNIIGGLRVLEYARRYRADRVLYTQSWSDLAGYWDKEKVLRPYMPKKFSYTGDHAFYAIAKNTIVESMEFYKQEFGLKSFVFRLPNVYLYNPNIFYYVDGVKKPISYRWLIEKAVKGEEIEMWGDPNAFKDILYVKDLCQMMYRALLVDRDGGIYNAGTGVKTTFREQIQGIVDVFSSEAHRSVVIEKPEKPSFVSFVMDIGNAVEDLGYKPEYTYRKYLEDYKIERELKRFEG